MHTPYQWIGYCKQSSSKARNPFPNAESPNVGALQLETTYRVRDADRRYLEGVFERIPDKLRQLRVRHKLSMSMLAEKAGVKKRLVSCYEDPKKDDDAIPTWYLKKIAIALGYDEYHLCSEYHIFLDGNYGERITEWIQAQGLSFAQAQRAFGVKECALYNWRHNKTRPPRRVFDRIRGIHKKSSEL